MIYRLYHRCLKHHAFQQYQKVSTSNCIYAYSGKMYAKYPQTKVRFFPTFSNALILLQTDLILICILIFKYVTLYYTMFIYVNLKTAIFCIRFTINGTKECFPYYYLNGDICTGISMALYSANICIAITIIYFIIINMQGMIYRMSSWIFWWWLLLTLSSTKIWKQLCWTMFLF